MGAFGDAAKMLRASTEILRPHMNFATTTSPQTVKMSILPENAYEFPCSLELGAVFLPSYFEEYQQEIFQKSQIQVTLRSYETRSSCEKRGCRYDQLKFGQFFEVKRKFDMVPVNLLGTAIGADALVDTSPLQSYVLT